MAGVEVQERGALVERGVHRVGERSAIAVEQRVARRAGVIGQPRHPGAQSGLVRAAAQAAVHGVGGPRRVGAPGEVEIGQERGVQALDLWALAREVHED